MILKRSLCLLFLMTLATLAGCGSQSNEAVKPEKFAPPPPGDSAAEGGAAATTKAEG